MFPAGSTHRYDATTFDAVDPLLGGDEAFASLVAAAHARGIRVLGDLTTNHVGSGHEWFAAARAGRSPSASSSSSTTTSPHGYECWYGVPSLPKLDYGSPELRERMYAGCGLGRSPLARAAVRPRRLAHRRREHDRPSRDRRHLLEVAAGVRRAAVAVRPDAVVVGEHAHDARADLRPAAWHGTMNYAGFTRPVWAWLRGDDAAVGAATGVLRAPRRDPAHALAGRSFGRCGLTAQASRGRRRLHSWAILDSHDSPASATIAGSRERQLVGVGLQMTTPGVPMVFAGDEIGLGGDWGEDARRTMPWSRPETWDNDAARGYRELIELRRGSRALARGGIRYAHVSADAIAYLRESRERDACSASPRAPTMRRTTVARRARRHAAETLIGEDTQIDGDEVVLPAGGPAFHVWRIA